MLMLHHGETIELEYSQIQMARVLLVLLLLSRVKITKLPQGSDLEL